MNDPGLRRDALTKSTAAGTVLQLAMVVGGHFSPQIANLFAVGGMSISGIAGVLYSVWAGSGTAGNAALGGTVAGAGSGLLGLVVSYLLGDVPASLLAVGTASSGVTGLIGALATRMFSGRKSA